MSSVMSRVRADTTDIRLMTRLGVGVASHLTLSLVLRTLGSIANSAMQTNVPIVSGMADMDEVWRQWINDDVWRRWLDLTD